MSPNSISIGAGEIGTGERKALEAMELALEDVEYTTMAIPNNSLVDEEKETETATVGDEYAHLAKEVKAALVETYVYNMPDVLESAKEEAPIVHKKRVDGTKTTSLLRSAAESCS